MTELVYIFDSEIIFKDIQVMDLEVVVFAGRVSVYFSCRSVYVDVCVCAYGCPYVCDYSAKFNTCCTMLAWWILRQTSPSIWSV